MYILILEDNDYRMTKFRRELIGHRIDHAKTVKTCVEFILANKYDLIFLDHDLGGKEMVNSTDEETGYQVAVFIASFGENKKTPCVTHTCNPAGADSIVNVLPHAVKLPFPSLNIASVVRCVAFTNERDKRCQ